MIFGRIIVTTICAILAIASMAQAPAADPLAGLLKGMPQSAQTFSSALTVAAVAKADGWETESGKAITAAAATNVSAKKNLANARKLIEGDVSGLVNAFTPAPTIGPIECKNIGKKLTEQGFTVAGNALIAVYGTSDNRMGYLEDYEIYAAVNAWGSLPLDQVSVLAPLIEKRLVKKPERASAMFYSANDLIHTTTNAPEEIVLLKGPSFARLYVLLGQKRGLATTNTLRKIIADGHSPQTCAYVAEELAAGDPTNAWVVIQAAQLLRELKENARGLAVYQRALAVVPEPGLRNIRLAYLELSAAQGVKPEEDLLAQSKDPLAMADRQLMTGKVAEAVTQYSAIYNDKNASMEKRIAAWAGMLDTDPQTALTAGKELLDNAAKSDAKVKQGYLRWIGWELWRAGARDIPAPIKSKYCLPKTKSPAVALKDITDGYAQTCALMDALIAADADAVFALDSTREGSNLRFAISMLYMLNGKPKEGAEIAGYTLIDQVGKAARLADEAAQHISFNSTPLPTLPKQEELLAITGDLAETAGACPNLSGNACQYCGYLVMEIAKFSKGMTHDEDIEYYNALKRVTVCVVNNLPLKVIEANNLKVPEEVVPLYDAIQKFQENPIVNCSDRIFIFYLKPLMKTTRDTAGRNAVYHLIINSLESYLRIKGATITNQNAEFVALLLRDMKNPEIDKLATQLVEKYPKPVAPVVAPPVVKPGM